IVTKCLKNRSYEIKTDGGNYVRNRKYFRIVRRSDQPQSEKPSWKAENDRPEDTISRSGSAQNSSSTGQRYTILFEPCIDLPSSDSDDLDHYETVLEDDSTFEEQYSTSTDDS